MKIAMVGMIGFVACLVMFGTPNIARGQVILQDAEVDLEHPEFFDVSDDEVKVFLEDVEETDQPNDIYHFRVEVPFKFDLTKFPNEYRIFWKTTEMDDFDPMYTSGGPLNNKGCAMQAIEPTARDVYCEFEIEQPAQVIPNISIELDTENINTQGTVHTGWKWRSPEIMISELCKPSSGFPAEIDICSDAMKVVCPSACMARLQQAAGTTSGIQIPTGGDMANKPQAFATAVGNVANVRIPSGQTEGTTQTDITQSAAAPVEPTQPGFDERTNLYDAQADLQNQGGACTLISQIPTSAVPYAMWAFALTSVLAIKRKN